MVNVVEHQTCSPKVTGVSPDLYVTWSLWKTSAAVSGVTRGKGPSYLHNRLVLGCDSQELWVTESQPNVKRVTYYVDNWHTSEMLKTPEKKIQNKQSQCFYSLGKRSRTFVSFTCLWIVAFVFVLFVCENHTVENSAV